MIESYGTSKSQRASASIKGSNLTWKIAFFPQSDEGIVSTRRYMCSTSVPVTQRHNGLREGPIIRAEPSEGPHGFRTEEVEDAFVIHISGEVDLANACYLEEALKSGLKSGRGIIVDLHEVRYIDSTGLKLLFTYQVHAVEQGQHIVAAEATPNILKISEIVRFTEMIPIVGSVHDAVELLRAKRS